MPDVARAVEQIAAIHAQLATREVYRGWRALPVALSGLVGLMAVLLPPAPDPWTFMRTWLAVGVGALGVGCAEIGWRYLRAASALERRRTRAVMRQFSPALVAGALVPLALMRLDPQLVGTAPGLWALSLGLAIFAARPCLPAVSVWVACYYALTGLLLLVFARAGVPAAWSVGVPFGIGQGLGAALTAWTGLGEGASSAGSGDA